MDLKITFFFSHGLNAYIFFTDTINQFDKKGIRVLQTV